MDGKRVTSHPISQYKIKILCVSRLLFSSPTRKCNFTVKNQVVEIVQHFHLIVNMLISVWLLYCPPRSLLRRRIYCKSVNNTLWSFYEASKGMSDTLTVYLGLTYLCAVHRIVGSVKPSNFHAPSPPECT